MKTSTINLEKSKTALEKSVNELRVVYDDCCKENESEKIIRIELSKECDRFKNEIQQLNSVIEELNKKNQAVQQESKKQSLLELEITDYEKSLSEVNSKLDSLQKDLLLKTKLLDQANDEKSSLQAQIQFLESQNSTDQQRATELKVCDRAYQCEFLYILSLYMWFLIDDTGCSPVAVGDITAGGGAT